MTAVMEDAAYETVADNGFFGRNLDFSGVFGRRRLQSVVRPAKSGRLGGSDPQRILSPCLNQHGFISVFCNQAVIALKKLHPHSSLFF